MTLHCPAPFANRLDMLGHIEGREEELALVEDKNRQNRQEIWRLQEEVLGKNAELNRSDLML